MYQGITPLFTKLKQMDSNNPLSFHVPGHKNGQIYDNKAIDYYGKMLKIDMTELPDLDDLHAPTGVIREAEALATSFFQSEHTFFLVGGSTAGNLAMILAVCNEGDKVIVQRNSHKSIINGLELSGANPIFITPEYDQQLGRYTNPSIETLQKALKLHPDAKAVVLTYPDYFGITYPIREMIEIAHSYNIPVLVDEAHGVHFSLGSPFPTSSLHLGADIVVQSAHKMAPAMTMASYLHIRTEFDLMDKVAHYLELLQSSSPSYPLMASLDIARHYLATLDRNDLHAIEQSVLNVRNILSESNHWSVVPISEKSDLLKITLHVKHGLSTEEVVRAFEKEQVYTELSTHNQILFIHGLAPFGKVKDLKKAVKSVNEQLINRVKHATIDISKLFNEQIQGLVFSYQTMKRLSHIVVPIDQGMNQIAAESVIPYPPGVPIILKGERITAAHIEAIQHLLSQGVKIQQRHTGIKIYSKENTGRPVSDVPPGL
ncbi:aminotransferase class I/II-fold pyridoxal phosphate-dependent enzyme [Oceanobacillus bengalensis]|uniref:Aminotransferase class I/II-fold pyridoxal phosphate-dependent enzyme n=1 Tax=Oceanobacillus bengalensis TaxID=1435466 RepID=A0A494YUH5_9BACI|nr:aminotransferase class I/II-fold pyridoxal phosphate-dependent enzyme [Oceanobacillus bengalensis]RKQ13749.1 aminotransferase class I/II-fold pyridoxal phosphate-dependent enzyme [Oceanobacillus bengalensis]